MSISLERLTFKCVKIFLIHEWVQHTSTSSFIEITHKNNILSGLVQLSNVCLYRRSNTGSLLTTRFRYPKKLNSYNSNSCNSKYYLDRICFFVTLELFIKLSYQKLYNSNSNYLNWAVCSDPWNIFGNVIRIFEFWQKNFHRVLF